MAKRHVLVIVGILHPPNCSKPHHLAKVLLLGWNIAFLEAAVSPPVTPLVSLKLKLRKVNPIASSVWVYLRIMMHLSWEVVPNCLTYTGALLRKPTLYFLPIWELAKELQK